MAFGLPGRSTLESLLPYAWGSRGQSPLASVPIVEQRPRLAAEAELTTR